MKFLILSVTTGEGHNSTARAIRDELNLRGAECEIIDTFNYISPELAKIISDGYLFVTEYTKSAYRLGYGIAEKHRQTTSKPIKYFQLTFSRDLADYINAGDFDAIVFTHPFAGILLGTLKERGIIKNKTIGILTDFHFHPYWEDCTSHNYVVVPSVMLMPQAYRKGFKKEQILPLGIPINPNFSSRIPKDEARIKLGLDPELRTLLLMGGSMGYGNIAATLERLDAMQTDYDYQIIVVCGNNEDMRAEAEKIAAASHRKMLILGFVDYISLIMDASDCIITKPGGLTTSESLAKGIPMIIVNPIPGHEERNAEFLVNNGCAVATSKTVPVDECIYQLLSSTVRLDSMKSCIAAIGKPKSTADLAELLVNISAAPVISENESSDMAEKEAIYLDEEGNIFHKKQEK